MSVKTKESIYNLIPPPIIPAEAARRHKSKFRDVVCKETKHLKTASKTMGPAKVPTHEPKDFLKKHSKEPKLPPTSSFKYLDNDSRRPPVPTRHDQPQLGTKSTKNYITNNAVIAITAVPKKPQPKYVDSPKGTTHPLEESGLMPHYVHKKTYGKVPDYLELRKKEMAEAQAEYERYIRESIERDQMSQISNDERQAILDGLKKNWEQLHHEYQGLSVVTDTVAKKARKERMESEMKQLEKDIELIEKHTVIYVENNTACYY